MSTTNYDAFLCDEGQTSNVVDDGDALELEYLLWIQHIGGSDIELHHTYELEDEHVVA